MSSLKFYRTFGQRTTPARMRRRLLTWLLVATPVLLVLIGLGIAGIVNLMLGTYRADFENTKMPPYRKNLTFAVSDTRLVLGDAASIEVTLANPSNQDLLLKRLVVQVPPRFFDAFTVDDQRASIEREADSSGTIRYFDVRVAAGRPATLAIPLQAVQAGNFGGQISLKLDLAVPLPEHPWYMPVDASENYVMTMERSLAPEWRIVLKP